MLIIIIFILIIFSPSITDLDISSASSSASSLSDSGSSSGGRPSFSLFLALIFLILSAMSFFLLSAFLSFKILIASVFILIIPIFIVRLRILFWRKAKLLPLLGFNFLDSLSHVFLPLVRLSLLQDPHGIRLLMEFLQGFLLLTPLVLIMAEVVESGSVSSSLIEPYITVVKIGFFKVFKLLLFPFLS